MKAILCRRFGPPEDLTLEDVPSPQVQAGTVKIALRACGVNFPDVLMIQGLYQFKPPFPFSPGLEVAGNIVEVGEGVAGYQPGQPVMATLTHGGFAEEVIAPAAVVTPLPADISFERAASFPLAYGTAHIALTRRANLQAGETLLVLGAAGGVGLAAVELGARLGAHVIAAASSEEKLALAESYGARDLIDYSRENLSERLKALTGGRGVDVVFDPVGGDAFDQAARRIAWEGRYLAVGFASGRIPSLPANIALLKNASLVGVYWGAYFQNDPAVIRRSFAELLPMVAAGEIKPRIHKTFPLSEAAAALRELMDRRVMGKALLAF